MDDAASSGLPQRRSQPYRAAFQTPLDYRAATEHVRGELRVWLRNKRLDVERFDAGRVDVGLDAVLRFAATSDATGWQLREEAANGVIWVSRINIVQATDESWVSVAVEAIVPQGILAPDAKPPKLVRALVDGMDAHDGDAELRSYPVVVSQTRCEELLEIVCDPERRLPLVLGSPAPGSNFEAWRKDMTDLMFELPGLASLYVLDPIAAPEFNAGMGATHSVDAGAVRTFLPDLDPAIESDAVRHRILPHWRIAADPRRARNLLAALPRQRAATADTPTATLAVSGIDFARSATPPDETRLNQLEEEVAVVNELLTDAGNELRQLNQTLSRQQDEMMDLAHELEVAQQRLERSAVTERALRRRLVTVGRAVDAYAPVDLPPPLPTTFDELHSRLAEFANRVVYTGSVDHMLRLDTHPQNATWAQTVWQVLRAMHDYAEAKAVTPAPFAGDFKTWCENPVGDGHTIPPRKVVRNESNTVETTMKYAQPRIFPVPPSVNAEGLIFMSAHIRLGADGQVSPRMHYYDATSKDGRIYVGYVGAHLPNTRTT